MWAITCLQSASVLHLSCQRWGRRACRIKDRRTERYPARRSWRKCLGQHYGERGNLFQDFPGLTTHSCTGWKTRSPCVPVMVRLPPFKCPASPGSSGAKTTFSRCFGSPTEGIYIPCIIYRKIARAASLCFGGEPASPRSFLGNLGTYFRIWDCHFPWG